MLLWEGEIGLQFMNLFFFLSSLSISIHGCAQGLGGELPSGSAGVLCVKTVCSG